MSSRTLSGGAPEHSAAHPSTLSSVRPSGVWSARKSAHLAERSPLAERRRRRTLQRFSVVAATLVLGTTHCENPQAATADATAASVAAPVVEPVAAVDAPVVDSGTPASPVSPASPVTTLVLVSPIADAAPTVADPTVAPVAPVTPVAAVAEPAPLADVHDALSTPTVAAAPAAPARVVVPGPEGTEVQGRCTQYEDLLMIYAPEKGWDVLRMSRLAWRESNCWAVIRSTTSDSGLLQINDIGLEFLNEALGEHVDPFTLMDPVQNVRAAAALCTFWVSNRVSCYQPWSRN